LKETFFLFFLKKTRETMPRKRKRERKANAPWIPTGVSQVWNREIAQKEIAFCEKFPIILQAMEAYWPLLSQAVQEKLAAVPLCFQGHENPFDEERGAKCRTAVFKTAVPFDALVKWYEHVLGSIKVKKSTLGRLSFPRESFHERKGTPSLTHGEIDRKLKREPHDEVYLAQDMIDSFLIILKDRKIDYLVFRDEPSFFYVMNLCLLRTRCKICSSDGKHCGGCRMVAYCNEEHQRSDWKNHKPHCRTYSREVKHILKRLIRYFEQPMAFAKNKHVFRMVSCRHNEETRRKALNRLQRKVEALSFGVLCKK
jgi:hypothetical protein